MEQLAIAATMFSETLIDIQEDSDAPFIMTVVHDNGVALYYSIDEQ